MAPKPKPEAQKVVKWNSTNPVGTICEWCTPCGTITQLKVETDGHAFPGYDGEAYVICRIIGLDGLNDCTADILIDQLKPIKPEGTK